jgi:hypothetical protein
MATLKLLRSPEKANENVEMTIYINDSESGCLKNDEQKIINIPAGKHKLALKSSDFSGIKTYTFQIKEDETKGFVISGNGKAKSFEPFVSGLWLVDFLVNGIIMLYLSTVRAKQFVKIKELDKSWL